MSLRRWIALVVLVAIGIGLLVVIVAVPWGDDAPAAQATPVYHRGEPVHVSKGDEFVIALSSNPSTGYSWAATDDPDVAFVSSRETAGGGRPGASVMQVLTFRAVKPGQSTLELTYARSFEPDVPAAETARFPVTVK
jgi:predicted secreted protein